VQVPDEEAAVLRFALCDVYRNCTTITGTAGIGTLIRARHTGPNDETFFAANYLVMLDIVDTKLVSLPIPRPDCTMWYFAQAGMQSGFGGK